MWVILRRTGPGRGRVWRVPGIVRGVGGARLEPSHQPAHRLPSPPSPQPDPLILRPGPIYAVDGDRGINQRIIYSILRGEGASLHLAPAPDPPPHGQSQSGPWTAGLWRGPAQPSCIPPRKRGWHFCHQRGLGQPHHGQERLQSQDLPLAGQGGCPGQVSRPFPEAQGAGLPCKDPLVTAASPPQGEQEDLVRYSVTQVTVEARAATGSLPRFPQSLYRGALALGSGVGVAVLDAADPSQPLRIQAQDPEFPVGAVWSLGGPGFPSGGRLGAMGAAWAQGSLGSCSGPQLGHHLPNHQQLQLPDGRGGGADGCPAGAGWRPLCGGEEPQHLRGGGQGDLRGTSPFPL